MKVVTSFGPARIPRQQKCLASWIAAGCTVVGMQSPGEAEHLQPSFPNATLIETDLVGDLFGRPKLVRVKALVDLAVDECILITNADIQVKMSPEDFQSVWGHVSEKELKVGIRWDVHLRTHQRRLFKWGIDAFLITPQIATDLPDIGMTMGCPGWDYWIPWYLVKKLGYKITTSKAMFLIHEIHSKGWSQDEYQRGLRIVSGHYGVSGKELTAFVQQATGRTKTPNWNPKP